MNTYEIIKELLVEKPSVKSIAQLERQLELSNGSISKWAKSKPSPEALTKVANFFNVSADYLLGLESYNDMKLKQNNERSNSLDEDEKQALVMFRKETEDMSNDEKERFNKALAGMMQTARSLIKDDSMWK